MKLFLSVNLIAVALLSACASQPVQVAEPVGAMPSQSRDLFDNAMVVAGGIYPIHDKPAALHVFPKGIMSSSKVNQDENAAAFLKAVCTEGGDVRYEPKAEIKLIVPKAPKNIGLDEANAQRQEYLAATRKFLREHFFASGRANQIEGERTVFKSHLANNDAMMVELYSIPGFTDQKLKEFYSEANPYYPSWTFLAIAKNPTSKPTTYLVPQYFTKSRWRYGEYTADHFVDSGVVTGWFNYVKPDGTNEKLAPIVVAYEQPWRLKNGEQIFPLDMAAYPELATLDRDFTMIIPPDVQSKYFKDEQGLPEVCGTSDWCGYTQDRKFSATKALSDREILWNRYYRTFTDLTEASNADGSIITFNLNLKMGLFCKYARAKSDLQSK